MIIMPFYSFSANYLKVVYGDYKTVVKETGEDIKEHPLKTGIYLSILSVVGYLWKNNPSERSFRVELLEHMNDLLLVGDLIRNPRSDSHMQRLMWCYNNGQMRRMNLGVCSFMWQDNFPEEVDLFEAQCKPIMVGWLEFKDRILDIGVAGRWLWLNEAMIDYDINSDEWPDESEKP